MKIIESSTKPIKCKECKHCKETITECWFHSSDFKKLHPIKYKQFNGIEVPWC
jgi:hypothetical protein